MRSGEKCLALGLLLEYIPPPQLDPNDKPQSREEILVVVRRVILLGASNLTLSFPMLFESLHSHLRRPVEIMTAHGHGRSYGMWSRLFIRGLPGIQSCRLWDDVQQITEPVDRTLALLTDVGNDLLYGADVQQICEWVSVCLSRLQALQAETVLTMLPICSVKRLKAWKYHLTRSCFFPTSRVSYADMLVRATELNDALSGLGTKFGATLIEPRSEWYGFDPIHMTRSQRATAWREILSSWSCDERPLRIRCPSMARAARLWALRPAERRLWGRHKVSHQPALSFGRECRLWLY